MTREDANKRILLACKRTWNEKTCEEIFKALEQQNTWIPVSERAPEEGKTVIASTEYGVYPETRFTKEYGWEWAYEAGADYWRELKDVLAWMPLPPCYEPQERNDKCKNCEYYRNPDYTKCHECEAERSDKE